MDVYALKRSDIQFGQVIEFPPQFIFTRWLAYVVAWIWLLGHPLGHVELYRC